MTHRLSTDFAKNYCNRALIVKVIVENVVTCFLLGHSVLAILSFTKFDLLTGMAIFCKNRNITHRRRLVSCTKKYGYYELDLSSVYFYRV